MLVSQALQFPSWNIRFSKYRKFSENGCFYSELGKLSAEIKEVFKKVPEL